MNDTAKKLREAADYMKCEGVASVVGDIRAELEAIADELDELQARAAEANNLRQQLESAEDKAERRKKHIGYLNTALHDKNILLKQRGVTIERATAENGELRKQVPTERERQILDMWPRFEDGEPVMIGDEVDGLRGGIDNIDLYDGAVNIASDLDHMHLSVGERVKRPARSVPDADGVEIRVGDTVWHEDGSEWLVEEITRFGARCFDGDRRRTFIPAFLTHTRPDSWERLESDAVKGVCEYTGAEPTAFGAHDCDTCRFYGEHGKLICEQLMALDIVRRAKALAGVEVD